MTKPKAKSDKKYQSHIPDVVRLQTSRIGARLQQLQGNRSQNRWARELGIPQQNLSRYIKGMNPHVTFLVHLARREGVNLNWLLLGRGDAYREG